MRVSDIYLFCELCILNLTQTYSHCALLMNRKEENKPIYDVYDTGSHSYSHTLWVDSVSTAEKVCVSVPCHYLIVNMKQNLS